MNKKALIRYDARRATRSTCQINMEDLCNTNEDQEDLKNLAEITIKNLRNDITPASDNIQSQMLKHSPKESKSAMARLAIIIRKAKYFPPRIYWEHPDLHPEERKRCDYQQPKTDLSKGKILEKITMNPLFPIVSNPDRPSPISAEQFGNVSADAAGLVLMEIIRERTSRGKRTYVVFLDVK